MSDLLNVHVMDDITDKTPMMLKLLAVMYCPRFILHLI